MIELTECFKSTAVLRLVSTCLFGLLVVGHPFHHSLSNLLEGAVDHLLFKLSPQQFERDFLQWE